VLFALLFSVVFAFWQFVAEVAVAIQCGSGFCGATAIVSSIGVDQERHAACASDDWRLFVRRDPL
jgi:hypothetical protein